MIDYKGLIIITHPILTPITQADILAAIPKEWHSLPREIVEVNPIRTSLHEIDKIVWSQTSYLQRQQVKTQIEPLIRKYPDWAILYFGAAPIPLAVHLGFLLGTWKRFHVYQHNHNTKSWAWGVKVGKEGDATPIMEGLPKDIFEGSGEIIFRVQTAYQIAAKDTTAVVKEYVKQVTLSTAITGLDVIDTPQKLDRLAGEFETAFTVICSNFPQADRIHLFGAIPVGLAFLIGTKINPTVSAKIQTYQFHKGQEPHYERAIILQDQGIVVPSITEEDKKAVAALRVDIQSELGRIKTLSQMYVKEKIIAGRDSGLHQF